nr:DMT family transporter [Chelativorans sp.]
MKEGMGRGVAEMTGAMVISGTIGLLVVLSAQPVFNVVFFRCLFGAVTLLVVCAVLGLLRPDVISKRAFALALLGGAAIVFNWVLLFASFSRASISIATAVYNTQPFMLVGLGALFLREKVTLAKLMWLVMAFAGMLLIIQFEPSALSLRGAYLVGIALALGAAFLYAVAALVAKQLKGTPPHLIALIQVSLGIILLAPFADFQTWPQNAFQWGNLIALGVVHTGLMYVLLYGAIQKLPTIIVGALSFIYPVVAIIVDRIAFGQHLELPQLAGAVVILLAAAGLNLGWKLPESLSGLLPKGKPAKSESV